MPFSYAAVFKLRPHQTTAYPNHNKTQYFLLTLILRHLSKSSMLDYDYIFKPDGKSAQFSCEALEIWGWYPKKGSPEDER